MITQSKHPHTHTHIHMIKINTHDYPIQTHAYAQKQPVDPNKQTRECHTFKLYCAICVQNLPETKAHQLQRLMALLQQCSRTTALQPGTAKRGSGELSFMDSYQLCTPRSPFQIF
jgi:predicted TIM-barrel fold metal-dependent hydrolase